jgi:hypothetical protein
MPPVGARGRCPSRFPMASPLSIGIELQPGGGSPLGAGSDCSIALPPPHRVASWWCAARPCGGRGSCRRPLVRGGVVGVSAQQKPTRQPRSGAVGQWAGAVRIVRPWVRGRPCQRGSPITGAGTRVGMGRYQALMPSCREAKPKASESPSGMDCLVDAVLEPGKRACPTLAT